ncbi:DNA cytosine methyltransferase [Kangiella sp. M94]
MTDLHYIDLFAGAGGLSEGFIKSGFVPLAHVEADKSAAYTLKTRSAYHYLNNTDQAGIYQSYIKGNIDRDSFYQQIPSSVLDTVINGKIGGDNRHIFEKIDTLVGSKKVDLIIGGPPCQAYSVVGRAPLKHKKDDERTKLYLHYGRFLSRYKPKAFLFENVPGILTAGDGEYYKNLQSYYRRLGYHVEARLLNAIDYNVIQNRKRVIIIGWDKTLNWSYPEIVKTEPTYNRNHIFYDLPKVGCGENARIQKYSSPINKYLSQTEIRNCVNYVSQHITRPHNERDLKIYELAINQLNQGKRLKNSDIPVSMRTQKNTSSFLDRFKVVDNIPHTLIAHIAKDGHHFIHPDAKQLRSISVREAARIQSFPDDYYFEGNKENASRSAAYRQIGNAVPPLMAQRIAEKMKEML